MGWYYDYKPYVPVAQRRAQAAREVARRIKKGEKISPVVIEGRNIVSTFWGKAWCENLEGYSDFANRLPRGRTYVRNGSVVHLSIEKGRITALVSGSAIYEIKIDITPLPAAQWKALKARCAGKIGSLVELLQGKLSKAVMEVVTDRREGLFPKPAEIRMRCSCPDYADLCKHLAAVLYGVGHLLDSSPELLFQLRGVDHNELIEQAIPAAPAQTGRGKTPTVAADALGDIFGIEIDAEPTPKAKEKKTEAVARVKSTPKKTAKTADGTKKTASPTRTAKTAKAKTAKAAGTGTRKTAAGQARGETKAADVKQTAGKSRARTSRQTSTPKKTTAAGKAKKTPISRKG